MDFFLIMQVFFDAVLLFGLLFLFHYTVHQSRKKNEEADILKNIQVQEMKENLKELLMTLKQLGKEVSDNIQEQVREAEEKTELLKKMTQKLQKDLNKTLVLAEELEREKNHLEGKIKVIRMAQKEAPKAMPAGEEFYSKDVDPESVGPKEADGKLLKAPKNLSAQNKSTAVGFSSGLVREVYRMADSEMGVNEIVQKTQLSRAEVQLILNLRDNRFTTPN